MTAYHLFTKDSSTGKCLDCGLIDGHSNACHDDSSRRMIDHISQKLETEKKNFAAAVEAGQALAKERDVALLQVSEMQKAMEFDRGHSESCTCVKDKFTEKRINVVGERQREITQEEFAKGLGAEPMTPEEAADWRRKHGGVGRP